MYSEVSSPSNVEKLQRDLNVFAVQTEKWQLFFNFYTRYATGFLKLLLSMTSVCLCVSTPIAINYIHVILHLYNQLNKFVA